MKNKPLYEVTHIENFRDIIKNRMKLCPDHPAFLQKMEKGGKYETIMPEKYDHDIDSLGTEFLSMLPMGCRIAILSETRYEWFVTYLATTNGTGCVVPLDKELHAEEIKNMLERAEVDALVFSKSKLSAVNEFIDDIDSVKYFICMDKLEDDRFLYFWDVVDAGDKKLKEGNDKFTTAPIDPNAMTILLFTSGTTSKSKAVMLCQRNICKNLMAMYSMIYIDTHDVFFSVLPLHHTYECTCGFLGQVYRGSTIAVCEGLRYITTNIKECNPTCILMVPAMLEMFYRTINKKLNADPKLKKKFDKGVKLSKFLMKFKIDIRRKLFKEIHENFGGRVRLIIVGGAPIDPQILEFFQNIGMICIQGYGLTECAPLCAVNRDVDFKNNAAGMPVVGTEVKLINPDEDGIGEFAVKGDNVFLGYYKNEEATKEALDSDGFYHTGDLGYIDEDGFCIITGRKKNVIIAKNGKNVFPEEIEYLLSLSPFVQESVVSGVHDERKDDILITATIFPNMDEIEAKLNKKNPSEEEIMPILEAVCDEVNEKLINYKKIKNVVYRPNEFEKNTSKKIKRY